MGNTCCAKTGDDSDDASKKLDDEEALKKKRKEEEDSEAPKLKNLDAKNGGDDAKKGAGGVDNSRGTGSSTSIEANRGTHRDRIMALFAKYEPEKLVHLDAWLDRLPSDARREGFIREYVEKHGPEPPGKLAAVRGVISEHNGFCGDKYKMQDALNKFKACEPGKEVKLFEEIFGWKALRALEPVPEALRQELSDLKNVESFSFSASEERQLRKHPATYPFGGEPCAQDLKDRIVAMLVEYDVERLATIREEDSFPDTETGAEFLYDLIEKFGEEPESKKAAVADLLRDVFQEHDPHRLRSLPTIVAMAMSTPGVQMPMLVKILRQYGIVKQCVTQQEMIERGLTVVNDDSSSNNNIGGGGNKAEFGAKRKKMPGMSGGQNANMTGVQKKLSFKAAVDLSQGPPMSSVEKAHSFLDETADAESAAAVAAKIRAMSNRNSGYNNGNKIKDDAAGLDLLLDFGDESVVAKTIELDHDVGGAGGRVVLTGFADTSSDDDADDGNGNGNGLPSPSAAGHAAFANDDFDDDILGSRAKIEKENVFLAGQKSAANRQKNVLLPSNLMPAPPPM